MNDTQSRKWLLTLNNPKEHGYSREVIAEKVKSLTFEYCCLCDEVSESGTPHTHIYFYSPSPIKFSRLKKVFPEAHIDKARGTSKENMEYVSKTGKWKDDPKADTSIEGTFQEIGVLPKERLSAVDKKEQLREMVAAEMTAKEIIDADAEYVYQLNNINGLIELHRAEKYKNANRELKVTYLFGATGTFKTSSIYRKHGDEGICRVTSYRKNGNGVLFDAYHGEPVLVFEEFYGQVPIEEMLNYLDVFPLNLPARYTDRVACYERVYITSNIALHEQYPEIQQVQPETWNAFLRRINEVIEHKTNGEVVEYDFPEMETIENERTAETRTSAECSKPQYSQDSIEGL